MAKVVNQEVVEEFVNDCEGVRPKGAQPSQFDWMSILTLFLPIFIEMMGNCFVNKNQAFRAIESNSLGYKIVCANAWRKLGKDKPSKDQREYVEGVLRAKCCLMGKDKTYELFRKATGEE